MPVLVKIESGNGVTYVTGGLDLAFGYQLDTFPEAGEELADVKHDLVFRISYTGTTDFLLSLDFTYGWFQLKDRSDASKFSSTLVNLRYYF